MTGTDASVEPLRHRDRDRSSHDPRRTDRVLAPRQFAVALGQWTARDIQTRYRTSGLRAAWTVLQPFFFVGVYVLVFGVVFEQTGGDLPFLTYLLAGVVVYRVVANAIASSSCLVDNLDLISHASFPREVIPISRVAGHLSDLAVTVVALFVTARLQGVAIGWTAVLLPLVLVGTIVLATAICVFTSIVQVFVRDLQFVLTFMVMGLFFASPITYQADQLPSWLSWLEWANPISVFVRATRDVALRDSMPDAAFWVHLPLVVLLLVGAVAHLRSIEHRIVDLA